MSIEEFEQPSEEDLQNFLRFNKYFISGGISKRALETDEFLTLQRGLGVYMSRLIASHPHSPDDSERELPFNPILRKGLERRLEYVQQTQFDLMNRIVLTAKIDAQYDRLKSVVALGEDNRTDLTKMNKNFYNLVLDLSHPLLYITYIFFKCSDDFKELFDFLNYVQTLDTFNDLDNALAYAKGELKFFEPSSPMTHFLFEALPFDITGIHSSLRHDVISAWHNRINMCKDVLKYLRRLEKVLAGYDKYLLDEEES